MANKAAKFLITAVDKTKGVIGGVTKSLRKLKGVAGKVTKTLAGMFGISTLGGVAALGNFVNETDKLAKVAGKLGITTEALSKLHYAAELTGVDVRTMDMALQRLGRRSAEAAIGVGEAKGAIKELGLDAKQLAELPLDEQFKVIADALDQVQNQTHKVRLAFKLFDSEGVALVQTTEGGRAAIDAYGDELERLGGVISGDTAQAAEDMKDAMTRLNTQMDSFLIKYGPGVLEMVSSIFDAFAVAPRDVQAIDEEMKKVGETIDGLQEKLDRKTNDPSLLNMMFGDSLDELSIALIEAKEKMGDLLRERSKLLESEGAQKARKNEIAEAGAHQRKIAAVNDMLTADLKQELKERARAYKEYLSEVRKAQNEEADIIKEFDALVNEMRSNAQGDSEDLDLIDLSGPITDARKALSAGDYEEAIRLTRQAGEMLRNMKESGNESNIVLAGMANKIKAIAVEAAKARTEKAIINADESKAEIDKIKKMIESAEGKVKVGVDTAEAERQLQTLTQPAEKTIFINYVESNQPGGGGYDGSMFDDAEAEGGRP